MGEHPSRENKPKLAAQEVSSGYPDSGESEETFHPLDYLRIIVRRKWVLIISFCTVLTATAMFTFLQTPLYMASATIRIYAQSANVSNVEMLRNTRMLNYFQIMKTEFSIIKSRDVAKRVINKLHLALHPVFADSGGSGSLSNGGDKKALTDEGSGLSEGKIVNALIGMIITVPIKGTMLAEIRCESADPVLAASVANTFAVEYISRRAEIKSGIYSTSSEQLNRQLKDLKKALAESEEEWHLYAKENNLWAYYKVQGIQDLLSEEIRTLNQELTGAVSERIKAESKYLYSMESNPELLPETLSSKVIPLLEIEYARINAEYEKELTRVQPEHPAALELKAQLDTIGRKLKHENMKISRSIKEKYIHLVEREKGYRRQMNDLLKRKEELDSKMVQYNILQREVESNRRTYEGLLQRTQEVAIMSGLDSGSVQIIEKAVVPRRPYKPNKKKNLGAGAVAGLILGLGLTFFIEFLDTSIKGQDDVEGKIGLVFLGGLPSVAEGLKGKYN